jgi:hypothetical protein
MKILPSIDKWTYIGSLSGGVDIKGFLQIKEEKEVKWKKGVFLMIENNGLFIPFEVSDFYFKNEIPYVKLYLFPVKHILKWKNSRVFAEYRRVNLKQDLHSVLGYEVHDEISGIKVGIIKEIQEFSLNKILILENNDNKEIFIPFHDDLITKKSENKIYMKLPENLLNINK